MGRAGRRLLALAAAVVAVQLATAALDAGFYLTQLTMAAYYGLVVIGLALLLGYCGQISLGHAGFFAIGGYATAVLTTRNLAGTAVAPLLERLGLLIEGRDAYGAGVLRLSPWLAFAAALAVAAAVALVIGWPVLKLRGHYLAMATLGFGTIVYRVALGTRLLGEADGITGVPEFAIVPGLAVSGGFAARVSNYYIAWALVIVGMLLATNLVDSRIGRALRSLHGSEEAAGAVGVDTARLKLAAFVLSALYAAVGGFFMTHYNAGIGPSEASVMKSVRYVAIVALGGMANVWRALGLGVLLNFLSLRGAFGTFDDAVFGLALIVIMVLGDGSAGTRAGLRERVSEALARLKARGGSGRASRREARP
jgi:branched-chain amino acid transport system permease protein